MTDQEKAELVEVHHQQDEMSKEFQKAVRELAARCSACGQPLPPKEKDA